MMKIFKRKDIIDPTEIQMKFHKNKRDEKLSKKNIYFLNKKIL